MTQGRPGRCDQLLQFMATRNFRGAWSLRLGHRGNGVCLSLVYRWSSCRLQTSVARERSIADNPRVFLDRQCDLLTVPFIWFVLPSSRARGARQFHRFDPSFHWTSTDSALHIRMLHYVVTAPIVAGSATLSRRHWLSDGIRHRSPSTSNGEFFSVLDVASPCSADRYRRCRTIWIVWNAQYYSRHGRASSLYPCPALWILKTCFSPSAPETKKTLCSRCSGEDLYNRPNRSQPRDLYRSAVGFHQAWNDSSSRSNHERLPISKPHVGIELFTENTHALGRIAAASTIATMPLICHLVFHAARDGLGGRGEDKSHAGNWEVLCRAGTKTMRSASAPRKY